MKNNNTINILFGALVLMIASCQPDEFPGIGERETVVPKLTGTWTLTKVVQRDNDAERKAFPVFAQTQDITEDFPFSDFKITLNADASGTPTTFAIDKGDSPNIIGDVSTGSWTVDDLDFPSKLVFTGGSGATIELGSFTGLSNGEMILKLIRTQPKAGKPEAVVTYQYSFTKE
jgi:hypothetical protein